jgi:glutathione S-transferase
MHRLCGIKLGDPMIELYQFPGSHFCEKARWALEYKGVPYRPVNLLPGFHLKPVRALAPRSSLPVLVDGTTVVQDSSAIITYLDTSFPGPALTPRDPQAARAALEWETYLADHIGVTLRLWFYYHVLPDRGLALKFLLQGTAWHRSLLFRLKYPEIRDRMVRYMNINADAAARAEEKMLAALERLDEVLNGRGFLVEDRFSRADLTACALLSPWCIPQQAWTVPTPLLEARNRLEGRRFYRWVRDVYENYRQASTGSTPAAA